MQHCDSKKERLHSRDGTETHEINETDHTESAFLIPAHFTEQLSILSQREKSDPHLPEFFFRMFQPFFAKIRSRCSVFEIHFGSTLSDDSI